MEILDSQAQEILDQHAKYNTPPIESLSPEEARNVPLLDYAARDLVASQVAARMLTLVSPNPEQVGSVGHIRIPGRGGNILARVYTPSGDGPFPVLVYFHGGGWVIANLDVYDASARGLCNAAECIVISVAYRQAPEHKFPAAVEDAYDATLWAMNHAAHLNGDPDRVAVGGESAGGNLAAVVCLALRDQDETLPVHQLLIYPVTDFVFDKASFQEHENAKPLNSAMMPWFAKHYLRNEADATHPHASPLREADLSGLPSATVINAENDPLRDDGRLYAERLREAGVPVTHHLYEGVMHEFFGLKGLLSKAEEAVQQAATELKEAFNRSEVPLTPMPLRADEVRADELAGGEVLV